MYSDRTIHGSRYDFDPMNAAEAFIAAHERRMREVDLIRQAQRSGDAPLIRVLKRMRTLALSVRTSAFRRSEASLRVDQASEITKAV